MTCCPVLGSCLSFMSGFLSSGLYRRLCKCRRDFFHHLLHGNMQSNFAAFETAVSGIAMWIGINELNLYCVFFYAYLEYLNRPPMIRSLFQFFFFFFFQIPMEMGRPSQQPIFVHLERKIVERFPIRERDRWDDLASSKMNWDNICSGNRRRERSKNPFWFLHSFLFHSSFFNSTISNVQEEEQTGSERERERKGGGENSERTEERSEHLAWTAIKSNAPP